MAGKRRRFVIIPNKCFCCVCVCADCVKCQLWAKVFRQPSQPLLMLLRAKLMLHHVDQYYDYYYAKRGTTAHTQVAVSTVSHNYYSFLYSKSVYVCVCVFCQTLQLLKPQIRSDLQRKSYLKYAAEGVQFQIIIKNRKIENANSCLVTMVKC